LWWRYWTRLGLRQDAKRQKQVVARLMRSLVLGLFSFEYNQIPVRSAALTFTAILGLVPFVVILSAVAGRFGYFDMLQRFLPYVFDSLNLDFPLDPILALLQKTEGVNFRTLGLVGSAGLLVSFFLSMNNIELAIGHIWNLRKPRNIWATIKAYIPFLALLILLLGILGHVLLRFRLLVENVDFPGIMPILKHGAALVIGTSLLTGFIWVALTLLLFIVPNTRVKLIPAMIGASVTTLALFGLTRLFFFFPHLLYSRNNVVLGSLAFVPAMLVFVYVIWILILYGAAVAFIYQRLYRDGHDTIDFSEDDEAFADIETDVLAVLAWVQSLAGDVEFPMRLEGDEGEARIFKQSAAVLASTLAEKLNRTPEAVEKAALPLQDLGWIRRRQVGDKVLFILKGKPENMDLLALHGLLVRLNPKETDLLRQLNVVEEIMHTLGRLYSKSKDHPPLSIKTLRALKGLIVNSAG